MVLRPIPWLRRSNPPLSLPPSSLPTSASRESARVRVLVSKPRALSRALLFSRPSSRPVHAPSGLVSSPQRHSRRDSPSRMIAVRLLIALVLLLCGATPSGAAAVEQHFGGGFPAVFWSKDGLLSDATFSHVSRRVALTHNGLTRLSSCPRWRRGVPSTTPCPCPRFAACSLPRQRSRSCSRARTSAAALCRFPCRRLRRRHRRRRL